MAGTSTTAERLDLLEQRLACIEEAFRRLAARGRLSDALELPVPPWQYLVHRPHPWRRQLYVRGRNLTARQLVGGLRANGLDEVQAAADYRLPAEAVREALAYVDSHLALLEDEAQIERLLLKREGISRGPRPLS